MDDDFNLDAYKCTSLPPTLWRVIHSESRSKEDPETGDLIASDSTRIISDEASFEKALDAHFNWWNRSPSCFLSVFSRYRHALDWARQRGDPRDVVIYEIDTERLPADTYVFDAPTLVTKFRIRHKHSADELIFLHRIPKKCLIGRRTLEGIESELTQIEEQDASCYAAGRFSLRRVNRPYHPQGELGTDMYYDSNDEYEQACWADDMMNAYEGHWDD